MLMSLEEGGGSKISYLRYSECDVLWGERGVRGDEGERTHHWVYLLEGPGDLQE